MIQSNPASSTINTNQAVIFRAKPKKIMFSLLILYLVQTKKGAISTSYTLSSYRPAFLKLLLLLCTPQTGITNQTTLPSGYNFFPSHLQTIHFLWMLLIHKTSWHAHTHSFYCLFTYLHQLCTVVILLTLSCIFPGRSINLSFKNTLNFFLMLCFV